MFIVAAGTKASEPAMEEFRVRLGLPDDDCAWQSQDGMLLLLYKPPTPLPDSMRTVRYEYQQDEVVFKLPEESEKTVIDLDGLLRIYDLRTVLTAEGREFSLLGAEPSTQRLLLVSHAP